MTHTAFTEATEDWETGLWLFTQDLGKESEGSLQLTPRPRRTSQDLSSSNWGGGGAGKLAKKENPEDLALMTLKVQIQK